jgi:ABC-2 type transport system permease protein
MIRALLYLRIRSLQNRLFSTARRLRQPKYLMGAIVGAAYFYFFFFRRIPATQAYARPGTGGAPHAFDTVLLAPLVGAVVMLVLLAGRLVLTWVSPEENPGLRFSEADICFLFPAPVTRRMLIQYNLLSSQFTILISSVCLTLIANRWSFLGGSALTHALGWWVILSTVNLQFVAAPLTVAQLTRHGIGGARRRAFGLVLLGVFLVSSAIPIWDRLRAPVGSDLAGPGELAAYATSLVDVGPLHWLLAVFKIVVRPFLAANLRAFLLAMGPALALLALQYVWVVRMETSFEEGSIALAQKSAQFIAARREGRRLFSSAPPRARREPFRLAERGRPETAFLWKNLISTWSCFTPRALFLGAGIVILVCKWMPRQSAGGALAGLGIAAVIMAAYTLVLGPQYARQDLRHDLSNADMLKSYPLEGWRIVLGELLAPVAILGGLWWLELLTLGLTVPAHGPAWLAPGLRLPFFMGLALVAPLVSALQLLAPNAGALLFPAWVQTPRNQGPGIDALGQRLIFMFGQIVATVIALLPAALSAAILVFASEWLIGWAGAILLATGAVVVILVGELWIGIWWLGERFERFDPAVDLRP